MFSFCHKDFRGHSLLNYALLAFFSLQHCFRLFGQMQNQKKLWKQFKCSHNARAAFIIKWFCERVFRAHTHVHVPTPRKTSREATQNLLSVALIKNVAVSDPFEWQQKHTSQTKQNNITDTQTAPHRTRRGDLMGLLQTCIENGEGKLYTISPETCDDDPISNNRLYYQKQSLTATDNITIRLRQKEKCSQI